MAAYISILVSRIYASFYIFVKGAVDLGFSYFSPSYTCLFSEVCLFNRDSGCLAAQVKIYFIYLLTVFPHCKSYFVLFFSRNCLITNEGGSVGAHVNNHFLPLGTYLEVSCCGSCLQSAPCMARDALSHSLWKSCQWPLKGQCHKISFVKLFLDI